MASTSTKRFGLFLTTALLLRTAAMIAGGWAVVTVDDLPSRVEAGRPLSVTFTVRQHGMTLLSGLQASIDAAAGREKVSADAVAGRNPGQYAATLTLPHAGEWVLTIHSGFGSQQLMLLPTTAVTPETAAPPAPPAAEIGRHLFVAKGCVTCHQDLAGSSNVSMGVAPALVAGKYQDSFLSRILADPRGTLPARADFVQMPNLALGPAEISALVSFINSSARIPAR